MRREAGLGKLSHVSLSEARRLAADMRAQVRQGIDPLAAKAAAVAEDQRQRPKAARSETTLLAVTRSYHERFIEPVMTDKHSRWWINSVELHVPQAILRAQIDAVEAGDLLDALQPLYTTIPETARKVRQRLSAVFDYAVLRKLAPTNPASAITRALRQKWERGQYRSLPYPVLPDFFAELRGGQGVAALALEFLILTAARSEEVRMAQWSEIVGDVWTVPAGRMKAGEPHVVYLSPPAAKVLERRHRTSEFVFASQNGKPQSNMAMLTLLSRMGWRDQTTVHGFRATFSTWANETGAARPDVIEACLAHREGDLVRRAYNRATFIAERQKLLVAWGQYCESTSRQSKPR
jgi:integrase